MVQDMLIFRLKTTIIHMFVVVSFALTGSFYPASAQEVRQKPSTCAAIAQSLPQVFYASVNSTPVANNHVRITFSGHSTYIIESAGGVVIATDFSRNDRRFPINVVTMNNAHDTHYTDYVDSQIKHVLRGWAPNGGKAEHYLEIEDVLIRNVTTDVVLGNLRLPDENSVFIFEVAGLCIGHLGHLHHELSDAHYAAIGRLDVVMVPIDGAMTLDLGTMATIVKRLRSSVILPMHARGWATPADFIRMLGDKVDHIFLDGNTITLNVLNLPARPTVMVPAGL